jgi:hypothetical protein
VRLWQAFVAGALGAIAALEACSSRGSPPCEEVQMDARTPCAPTDALVELVLPRDARIGLDGRYSMAEAAPHETAPTDAAAPDGLSPF